MRRILFSLILPLSACAATSSNGVGGLPNDAASDDAPTSAPDDMTPPADLNAPRPTIMDVTPADAQVNVGGTLTMQVTLSGPWFGQTPLVVALAADDPNALVVPASVSFNFNQSMAQVAVAATKVGAGGVTATLDRATKHANVTVLPAVKSIDPSPLRLLAGTSATVTITLSDPALQGGHDLALASGDPKIASLPATVHVDAGATTAKVMVSALAQGGPIGVSATLLASKQTTALRSITPVGKLAISEVLYDALGPDDGFEWIELWNGSNQDIDLSGYFIGSTYSQNVTTYIASTPALTGILKAGDCKVIGGPMADPMANTLAADFMYFDAVQFNPALPNGTMTTAEGVALFKGAPPAQGKPADVTTIVDAVIYGSMQRGLADETGNPGTLDVDYVKLPKQTLERVGPTAWRVQTVATAGNCDWLHP